MSKLRSVSTSFWSDPFIEDLSPSEKLLYLYFITNDKTNMLGIYELSIKKISFETGVPKETVSKALELFESKGKVKYVENYIVLTKFMKHRNFNTNMKKSAIDCHNNLPKSLKINGVNLSLTDPIESFETLSNHYGMVRKVEVEIEVETELEEERELQKENLQNVPIYYRSFKHLKLTFEEFEKLKSLGYSKIQIDDILDSIQNYKNNKNYENLFLTAKNWLKRETPALNETKKSTPTIKIFNG